MSELTLDRFVREQAAKLRTVIDEKPGFEAELWDYVEANKEADVIKTVEDAVGKGTPSFPTAQYARIIINKTYQLGRDYERTFEIVDPQKPAEPSDTQ